MKKIIFTISTVAVVGFGSAFFSPSVKADTVGELENKQAEIQDDRAEIKASLSDADAQIADVLFELQDT
ncbi:MAG TPA: peptidase, partial [Virgibacillus sp.]|nr:peptidase [Virgibacillus sp.]